ncbi:HAD-IB family hydrolase [bacterium]|nr:HAD-IB family hydrolase [bacterium]
MRTCAIFDLDGTIIDNSSEKTFVSYLLSKREISLMNLAKWALYFLKARSLHTAKTNKIYLKGKDYGHIQLLAQKCFHEKLVQHISKKAIDLIQMHKEQGRFVVLLSGSLDILVAHFKEYLDIDLMIGYSLEIKDGVLTGHTTGLQPYGKNKAIIAKQLAEEYELDLNHSYAYGNNYSDEYKLSLVKHPVVVNPDRKLRRIANKKGWTIDLFHKTNYFSTKFFLR